jgi:hypothetical protein
MIDEEFMIRIMHGSFLYKSMFTDVLTLIHAVIKKHAFVLQVYNLFYILKENDLIAYTDGIIDVISIFIVYINALFTSLVKTFSTIDVTIAQVILLLVMMITIMLEKVQKASMRRFMNILLAV